MNTSKASKDYIKLKKLLLQGYKPEHISVNLSDTNEKATITLVKNKLSETITSSEEDVIMLSFSLKSLFDQKGNSLLGEVKDLGKLYDDAKMLYDPDNKKLHAARAEIIKGNVNLKYVPHLLLRQFLEETSFNRSKPYLILKDDYYFIKVLQLEEIKIMYAGSEGLRKQVGFKKIIYDVIQELFKNAFH